MEFVAGGLENPAVQSLLREHLQDMLANTPAESAHALDLDALAAPSISLWTAWRDEELLGCGALKDLGASHAEIKSMRTSSDHLRQGVASGLLGHLIREAEQRGFQRLSLETGRGADFSAAHSLYARFEFVECAPFGDYSEDPLSVFLTRTLSS